MEIILLSALTFAASFVGTLTGFGSSTVMLPIVVLFYPLPVALFFVGIVHTFNDLWKVILFKHAINRKLLLTFGIPGLLTALLGAMIVFIEPQEFLIRSMGGFLIIYVLILFLFPKFKIPSSTSSSIIGGSISGFLAGAFGIGGPTRSMFLTAYNFHKDVYLFTSGAIALMIDIPRILAYYGGGIRIGAELSRGLLILIPVSFLGAELAKSVVNKISQDKFRKIIAIFILMVGLKLVLYP